MSYCVNCGVELDDSAKKCALCGTAVINPNKSSVQIAETPFSEQEHIPEGMKKQFIAYLVSVVFLIPNIVCFFVNAIFRNDGFWSFYVNATSLLVWIVFVFPFFTKKLRPYLMWFVDTLGICAYVYFFFAMGYEKKIALWYYDCALPMILTASLLVLIYMFWIKSRQRHWVLKLITIIADVAVCAVIYGALLDRATSLTRATDVGIIIFTCCAALIAFLAYCYTSKNMRRWLSKRFFV